MSLLLALLDIYMLSVFGIGDVDTALHPQNQTCPTSVSATTGCIPQSPELRGHLGSGSSFGGTSEHIDGIPPFQLQSPMLLPRKLDPSSRLVRVGGKGRHPVEVAQPTSATIGRRGLLDVQVVDSDIFDVLV